MEFIETSTWKSVHDEMTNEGWKVGWADYVDEYQETTWIVQAFRNGRAELADGFSLRDAIEKVYALTR